jgi:hypothetical protein
MMWMLPSVLGNRGAKRFTPWALLLAAAGWMACPDEAALGAATNEAKLLSSSAPASQKPKRTDIPDHFPKVPLAQHSQPRYVAIDLDSIKSQVAYLLFDGDVTNGYDRVFVWSPGHEKFGKKPIAFRHEEETKAYTAITTESVEGKIGAETKWSIRYTPETHGSSYRDYKTGKMVQNASVLVPCFYFSLDLKRGPARHSERKGGKYPLDITIGGRLYVADEWEKMLPTEAPWTKVYCSLSREPNYDKRRGFLRCKAHLQYWHDRWNTYPCTVRSLPDDTRVHIEVAPYLEKPIYEKDLKEDDIFMKPIDIDVPYGWYRVMFTFKSEFFKADGLNQNSDGWPMAFPHPFE